MLSKPIYGWSHFQLEGTSVYSLSYTDDIDRNIDEWSAFIAPPDGNVRKRKKVMLQKLARLKKLIAQREECFGPNRCFI